MSQQKSKPLTKSQKVVIARQCRAAILAYANRTINKMQYSAIRTNLISVGGHEIFERELRGYYSDQVQKGNPKGSF